ncbi:MAG: polysaccharide deacetylase family protein [Clostridiales bacterium]|nr:polysaccharide deacetylase family protein [Clostridiales bacterium]
MKAVKRKAVALTAAVMLLIGMTSGCALSSSVFSQKGTELLILMYHSVLKDPAKTGMYVITPSRLEGDMKYLQERGYETIVTEDLIDYVYYGKTLPEKPVILTFDDGHYNNLAYALPLLEQYDMQAVISVVGKYTERYSENEDKNPAYAYLSWEDIVTLVHSGRVEIQNHSYDMHESSGERRGSKRKRGESAEVYARNFSSDVSKLQLLLYKKCRVFPTAFTYPFGLIDEDSEKVLKQAGFLASYSCTEKINRITEDPECLWKLGRYNRDGRLTTEAFFASIGI